MTVVMRQQGPLDLHQVDDHSCLTCVTANALYVLGVTDTPDTRWVDRELDREPGCGAQRARARRFLLQQGLSLHLVCAYEPERFLQEGLDYLRRYYRQEWDSSWDEYWTRHRLERHRSECLATQELSTFGARMRTEHRQPTLADIRGALDHGRLVWVSIDNGWGQVDCHAVLVYGQRGNVFDVYSPELSRSCLQQYRRRRLDKVWLRNEGMTAVWRREPGREAPEGETKLREELTGRRRMTDPDRGMEPFMSLSVRVTVGSVQRRRQGGDECSDEQPASAP